VTPAFAPHPGEACHQEATLAQNGFVSSDLDFHLKQRSITEVIVTGVPANACRDATSRFAMELGYHVTLVRDATAAFSQNRMPAAHQLNGPRRIAIVVSAWPGRRLL
jgi:nicotinamidase-related amidase